MLRASYELTRDDIAAFIEHHQAMSPAARKQKTGCLVVGFAAMTVLPGLVLLTTNKPVAETALNIWPLLLGPILFAIFAGPYMRWRSRQMSNRMLNEGQNNGLFGACELTADDDALTETRPSGSTIRKWSSVERIVTTPSHVLIYTAGAEAFVVPRRTYSSELDLDVFVAAISERSEVKVENVSPAP